MAAKKPVRTKKSTPKKVATPKSESAFEAKVDAWFAIVNEAVKAKTVVVAKRAYSAAQELGIPADLFAEDDADDLLIYAMHDRLNARLNERIESLPATSPLVHELCCLRDLINTT